MRIIILIIAISGIISCNKNKDCARFSSFTKQVFILDSHSRDVFNEGYFNIEDLKIEVIENEVLKEVEHSFKKNDGKNMLRINYSFPFASTDLVLHFDEHRRDTIRAKRIKVDNKCLESEDFIEWYSSGIQSVNKDGAIFLNF